MILDEIIIKVRTRIARDKSIKSLNKIKTEALAMPIKTGSTLEQALSSRNMNFICEVKKASPSKGIIVKDFPYVQIAKDYERAGASAISVLTEEDFFKGKDEYLQKISKNVNIPILRKDFIIDEYQIYQAKVLGATAILLICAILDDDKLKKFYKLAYSLGLSCLVETHDELEVKRALELGAKIIGINNRDLHTFNVDINNSINLRKLIPNDVIVVAESGISTASDINDLQKHNIQAVLIGETLMKATNKVEVLNLLANKIDKVKVKICGIKSLEDVDLVNQYQPDYIGFVFAPSKRQIDMNRAKNLSTLLNPQIRKVGVFVNASLSEIVNIVQNVSLDIIQLHGEEDNKYIEQLRRLKIPIWQTIKLKSTQDILLAKQSKADMVLFDTYNKNNIGGTGKSFNWNLIQDFDEKFILAGGLNVQNVIRAIRKTRPYIVDLSSGLENRQGKDKYKIREFMETIRKVG